MPHPHTQSQGFAGKGSRSSAFCPLFGPGANSRVLVTAEHDPAAVGCFGASVPSVHALCTSAGASAGRVSPGAAGQSGKPQSGDSGTAMWHSSPTLVFFPSRAEFTSQTRMKHLLCARPFCVLTEGNCTWQRISCFRLRLRGAYCLHCGAAAALSFKTRLNPKVGPCA